MTSTIAQQDSPTILVCGGRDYADRDTLFEVLDRVQATTPISLVIHGAARGADTLAGEWATKRGIAVQEFPADWGKHGRAAGSIRNGLMLEVGKPDLVVAFPGGRGTAHMVRLATEAGVPVQRGSEA